MINNKIFISKLIPPFVKRTRRNLIEYKINCAFKRTIKRKLPQLKRDKHAKIIFIISSLSMWRYTELCKLLKTSDFFSFHILILPFGALSVEEKEKEINKIIDFLKKEEFPYTVIYNSLEFKSIKQKLKPDILVFPQPYEWMYEKGLNWHDNTDCLLIYAPYFLGVTSAKWIFNLPFHKSLWRNYQSSEFHFNEAIRFNKNLKKNSIVIGDLKSDCFDKMSSKSPWKIIDDNKRRKKLIWAPHFQIEKNDRFNRPDFLWLSDFMLFIAKKYCNYIQIAFKPHPRLKSVLYDHHEWGKERTNKYYEEWQNMFNTQLEDGEYENLFLTSDGLIHNSGSFIAEYLYVNKPVAYTTKNFESNIATLHTFGQECLKCHYIVETKEDIINFIEEIILNEKDDLKELRTKTIDTLHLCPSKNNVAFNLYEDLVNQLSERSE